MRRVLLVLALLIPRASWAQDPPVTLIPLSTLPADGSILGGISDVDILPNGEVLVLDSQVKEILVYDSEGTHVRTLGGEGQGPGEIKGAFEIEVTPTGGIWALDNGNARVSRWGPDGKLEDTHLFQDFIGGLVGWPDELVLTPAGVYLKIIPFVPGDPIRVLKLKDDLSGVADTVAVIPEVEDAPTCDFCPMTAGPDGRVLAAQGDTLYAIFELGPDAKTRPVIRREDLPAVKRTEAELERLNASVERLPMPEGGTVPKPNFPPFKSRFGTLSIGVDDLGRVWLLPNVGEGESAVLDLFSSRGAFLGSISLDVPLSGFRIKGDRFLGLSETALGEPAVRVYEIR